MSKITAEFIETYHRQNHLYLSLKMHFINIYHVTNKEHYTVQPATCKYVWRPTKNTSVFLRQLICPEVTMITHNKETIILRNKLRAETCTIHP
jgi:hypothetical protein